MFLNKESDGRYSPGSGQPDPNCSIRPVGNEMWMFERGNLFVPGLRSLMFWVFLVIVLPVVVVICSLVYLKKRCLSHAKATRPLLWSIRFGRLRSTG